jgi:hypothetical protein
MKATIIWRSGPMTEVDTNSVRETGEGIVTLYDIVGRTEQIVDLRAIRQITLEE